MSKEGRVIALAILTIFIYAFSILLQKGAFIFPFPLNELIFFISSVSIAIYQYKQDKILSLLFPVIGLTFLLSSEFYWAIFYNSQEMEVFSNSFVTDLFKILFFLVLIASIYISFYKIKVKLIQLSIFLSMFGVVLSLILGNHFVEVASLFIVFLISIKRTEARPSLNLWILLFILEATKLWSLMG